MTSQKTKLSVGIFVFSGIVIAVLAVIWLGMSRFLEKGHYYATYFNESVQGLDMDSPVKYRGVSIGRVERIGVAPDSRLIQVVMKIESGQDLDSGLVAQLKSVGITGSMFVELDHRKKGEPDRSPALNFPSEYPIVASRPSDISVLLRGLDDVLSQVKSLDLEGISEKIKYTLDNLNRQISDADMKGISGDIRVTLSSARLILENRKWGSILASVEEAVKALNLALERVVHIVGVGESALGKLEGILDEEKENIRTTFHDLKRAVENANGFLEKGSSLIGRTDDSLVQLKNYLLVTGQNLESASENLSRLIELIGDHPPQLLLGEPPPPRMPDPGVRKGD